MTHAASIYHGCTAFIFNTYIIYIYPDLRENITFCIGFMVNKRKGQFAVVGTQYFWVLFLKFVNAYTKYKITHFSRLVPWERSPAKANSKWPIPGCLKFGQYKKFSKYRHVIYNWKGNLMLIQNQLRTRG